MYYEKKSIGLWVFLSIITCGICELVWIATLQGDIARLKRTENSETSGGMVVLFTIITCGIYYLYWLYKKGEDVVALNAANEVPGDSSKAIIFLLLGIFSLGIVSTAIMQNDVNKLYDKLGATASESDAPNPPTGGGYPN